MAIRISPTISRPDRTELSNVSLSIAVHPTYQYVTGSKYVYAAEGLKSGRFGLPTGYARKHAAAFSGNYCVEDNLEPYWKHLLADYTPFDTYTETSWSEVDCPADWDTQIFPDTDGSGSWTVNQSYPTLIVTAIQGAGCDDYWAFAVLGRGVIALCDSFGSGLTDREISEVIEHEFLHAVFGATHTNEGRMCPNDTCHRNDESHLAYQWYGDSSVLDGTPMSEIYDHLAAKIFTLRDVNDCYWMPSSSTATLTMLDGTTVNAPCNAIDPKLAAHDAGPI